jgi:PAS domain S-box-containing protein
MSEALRLFLVEDDDNIAFVTRRRLESAGHHVSVCHSGIDALIVLGHAQFDLVILDHHLQDISGSELMGHLRQEHNPTPVLMITGVGDEQLAARVLREGALDYVKKDPNYLDDLPQRVMESVTRHRLQQNNNLLIAALESARDGIVISDEQGKVLHVNSALERMFGFSREELMGQNAADIFRSDRQSATNNEDTWRTLRARRSWQGELVNKRNDNTLLDTSLTISPIFNARGQMTHFVGIYRDITERKQMERQLVQAQKMQSIGTLAGGVAHEFNNLLAGMQGYATLALREPALPAAAREFLEYIVQLSDRAANLTRQLLAFARKPSLMRQPTDVGRLLQTTRDLMQRSLSIEVALEMEPAAEGMSWTASADANQLQQVLVNLSLNARDAMPKPQPAPIVYRLKHRLLHGELPAFPQNVPAGDYLVIEVEDQGSGMPAEVMAQALDPFFTTKEVGQGTGLGLPVAFGIITGHHGHLTLESRPGVGTRIGLYLQRLTRLEPDAATAHVQAEEPEASPRRRILVVDDEEAVVDIVRRFLEIAGHEVVCASSGKDALERLKEAPADIVILDWLIPKEEGRTNFRLLRQACPGLPILICTGLVQADQAVELLEESAVDLLRKPFLMKALWQSVNGLLTGKSNSIDN